jgi:putative NADPH-quinone reductase
MRILYLYAHPLPESFHAAIRDAAMRGLAEAGHWVDLCDLYAEGFDPVLGVAERRGYHDPPRTGRSSPHTSSGWNRRRRSSSPSPPGATGCRRS